MHMRAIAVQFQWLGTTHMTRPEPVVLGSVELVEHTPTFQSLSVHGLCVKEA